MPSDSYNLSRFVEAQDNTYATALRELQDGRKRSHWMWFIFPQIQGLGFSPTAQYYAIRNLGEAIAYLEHPVLGPRLRECAEAVAALEGRSLEQIFGYPDHLKFASSMTLFELAAGAGSVFSRTLDKYCGGQRDEATLGLAGRTSR